MRENAPDAQIHFWFSPWNIAMLSRNSEEIAATLNSFLIDIFLQELKIRNVKMVDNGYNCSRVKVVNLRMGLVT